MKKSLMFAMLFAFVGLANAQEKTIEKKQTNFEEWSEALSLTDTQIAQIDQINTKYRDKAAAIRGTATSQDFKALNDEKKQEIQNLLTPEQKVKEEQFMQKKEEEKIRKASIKSPSK